MDTLPKVSIIVPVYNVESYLSRCLDSILNQTFTEFECILVDDCSPDNCPAMCDEYALKDQRIRVIHNQKNRGSSLSRQIGLAKAMGDYILFVDSDDWIECNMLEELYQKITNDHLDMVCCDHYEEFSNTIEINHPSENSDTITLIKQLLGFQISQHIFNRMVKKSVFSKITFPEASYLEDFFIVVQLLYFSDRIDYIDKPLYRYCYNSTSLSHDKNYTRRTIEYYNCIVWVTHFLQTKFDDASVLDPELSNRVNKAKLAIILDKRERDVRKLFDFYPRSNQLIFNESSTLPFYHKILLFLATKKIIFPLRLLDLYYALRKKLQNRSR